MNFYRAFWAGCDHNEPSWVKGALLMQQWFSRTSAIQPAYSSPDTTTIRMDSWVLTFPRAKREFNKLIQERIWINAKAKREIAKMLRKKNLLKDSTRTFGNYRKSVAKWEADYINYRVVGGYYYYTSYSGLDDMTASLGNFTFRVLVSGSVAPEVVKKKRRHRVIINKICVYIKDSYDFSGGQFLGFWDKEDNSVSGFNFFSGDAVTNKDFRKWRTQNKRGGDFRVFSNLKEIKLSKPDTFLI